MLEVDWRGRAKGLRLGSGERLLDALDERPQTGIAMGCRSGHCGSCLVRVVRGAPLLKPPTSDEQDTLRQAAGGQVGLRLACQLSAACDEGSVELEDAPKA